MKQKFHKVKIHTMPSSKKDVEEGFAGLPPAEKPFHPVMWNLMLVFGVVMYGSYTILVHLCEEGGRLPFSSTSAMFVIECLKLCICIVLYIPEVKKNGFIMPPLSFAIPFAVPAVLYAVNNNIAVHMQLQMDPATYQVLGNMKILSTAFLYRLIIKRPITNMQWVALGVLALAGASNSYAGLQAAPGTTSAGVIHITMKGLVMISLYCFISGLAGVYTEYILKKKYEVSLHLQNGLLYVFGMSLNAGSWIYGAMSSDDEGAWDLFAGYSVYTWMLVATQAVIGLIMSAIFKHGNNIMRLFVISCAMLVTTVLSVLIFGLQLNVYFIVSFLLVVLALYLYLVYTHVIT